MSRKFWVILFIPVVLVMLSLGGMIDGFIEGLSFIKDELKENKAGKNE